jgi:hypothetical protein
MDRKTAITRGPAILASLRPPSSPIGTTTQKRSPVAVNKQLLVVYFCASHRATGGLMMRHQNAAPFDQALSWPRANPCTAP